MIFAELLPHKALLYGAATYLAKSELFFLALETSVHPYIYGLDDSFRISSGKIDFEMTNNLKTFENSFLLQYKKKIQLEKLLLPPRMSIHLSSSVANGFTLCSI